jgi:hypothetical protein
MGNATDYVSGLIPDVEVEEDIVNLLPFGDENEVMLKAVIDYITGAPAAKSYRPFTKGVNYDIIVDSKDVANPYNKEMYLSKPLILK